MWLDGKQRPVCIRKALSIRRFMDTEILPGQRIEMHPATDEWMMGDRYGEIIEITNNGKYRVLLDKSMKELIVHPRNIYKYI